MQKVSDDPLTVCEVCGGKLEKQWSLSGFQFKGEGWYLTDYSSKLKDKSADKAATEKAADKENSKSAETAEKKPSGESTAKTESASKDASEKSGDSKKETNSAKNS